jgi:hypothetical protein
MKISAISKLLQICAFPLVAALFISSISAQAPKRLVTQAVDEHNLITLKHTTHKLARAEFDSGAIPDSEPMSRVLLLLNRSDAQEAALKQFMDEQQTAGSPNFHHWLTPEEFGKQYGPSDEDIQAVTDWLASNGFQGVKVGKGRTVIEFSGSAGQIRNAFHTEMHHFMVRGEEHTANASDIQIPAALGSVVKGVASLNNFRKASHLHRAGSFRREKATGRITPLTTESATGPFAVGPTDFATIYNVAPLWTAGIDGSGVSIAIVGRVNINPQDVTDFRSMFGLPSNAPQIILNGPDPGIFDPNEEGEADLDVQWSGAVAKGAQIKFVVSETTLTTDGVDLSALYIVENNIAAVMSESFGTCEAFDNNTFENSLWQQAAAQGITVTVSTGDNGSAGCDPASSTDQNEATAGLAISGTASTPFNVAVGGTDFDQIGNQTTFWNTTNAPTTQASAKGYIPETTWNDSCANGGLLTGCGTINSQGNDLVAGSGGPSTIYTKPVWQTGTGVPADGHRDIPDVSLFASNGGRNGANGSFYITCQSDQNPGNASCNVNSPFQDFTGVGGTSASSPSFAGIMALVVQKTGSRQGNANYILYKLAAQANASCASSATPASTCIFYDTVKGNISVACAPKSTNCSNQTTTGHGILVDSTNKAAWATTAGYDTATGLGSVNVANLVNAWAGTTFTGSVTTITSLTPTNPAHGGSVAVTIHVAPASGTTTPTGLVSLTTSTGSVGIDSFPLTNGIASGTTTLLPGGSYSVIAHYSGDATFGASNSAPIAVNVGSEASKTAVSFVTIDANGSGTCHASGASVPYGSSYILRVDINTNGTLCADIDPTTKSVPTGTVTLTDKFNNGAATPLDGGTFKLNSLGYVEDQPIQLDAGSHSITASYGGDGSYQASSTANFAVTITQATTQTGVVASPSVIASGGSVTLTATVSSSSNSSQGPTGTVQFSNGSTALGAAVTCKPTGFNQTTGTGAFCTATLTTNISFIAPPANPENRPRWMPFEWIAALFALAAIVLFIFTGRMQKPRRAYAYAAIALFLIASATLVGCSGGSGGGGVGGGTSRTISAKYSGDANYAAGNAGTTTVTIQ